LKPAVRQAKTPSAQGVVDRVLIAAGWIGKTSSILPFGGAGLPRFNPVMNSCLRIWPCGISWRPRAKCGEAHDPNHVRELISGAA
jgi:hypothetical protein